MTGTGTPWVTNQTKDGPAVLADSEFGRFISGGYYLVRPVKRPDSFSALLPETLVTVSPCIGEVGPRCSWESDWGRLTLEQQKTDATECGVPAEELPELLNSINNIVERTTLPQGLQTCQEPPQVMPFGFSSFVIASAFYEQFAPPTLLLGIGLHASLVPLLNEQRRRDINNGYGLIERIGQRQTLRPGQVLGFEPLGFEAMSFHSWICNYFPESVDKELRIKPAANGFISDFADALEVTEHIRNAGGEPAIWLPWLIVQYGLGSRDV